MSVLVFLAGLSRLPHDLMADIKYITSAFSTPDATTDVHKTSHDSHDAPAGADGDGDAPMVSGAHLPKEGGTPMKSTETLPESSADDAKIPDPDYEPPSSTIVGGRIDRLRLALESRRVGLEPAVFDSVVVIVNVLTRLTLTMDPDTDVDDGPGR